MPAPHVECRWCKTVMVQATAVCPRCGRRAHEADPMPGIVDVPDLAIPAARGAPSSMHRVAAPAPARVEPRPAPAPQAPPPPRNDPGMQPRIAPPSTTDGTMRSFDADAAGDLDAGEPSIDLDLSRGPPIAAAAPPVQAPAGPSAGTVSGAVPIRGGTLAKDAASAPTRTTAPSSARGAPPASGPGASGTGTALAGVDPYEARALGDYGDPPTSWWKTPQYAYRVVRRRQELSALADQKRRELDRAEGAAADALLAFAEVVRSRAETLTAYGTAFDAVRASEQLLGQRDAQLLAETGAHRQRQAERDAKLSALEAQLTQLQIEERTVAGELSESDALLKRADARLKRAESEIRGATQATSASGDDASKGPPA